MEKKKVVRFLVLGICLFVLVLVAFVYFKPVPLISLPYTVSSDNTTNSEIDVSISLISFNGEYITDQVNKEALVDILSKFTCRRTLSGPSSYFNKDTWEISLNQGGIPLYIVLGETSFCYSSSNVKRNIIDAESLKQALNNMIDLDTN